MIRKGSKVKCIMSEQVRLFDERFEKDYIHFGGIFEVIDVTERYNPACIYIKSVYNIERSTKTSDRVKLHNEKYWCLSESCFEEINMFQLDDKLFDL